MWLKWFPWRYIVKRVAKAHGFLDPITLQARLHRFTQPSEVAEPIELLRAGAVLHARGLINSRVIQHNLDWVWPYWIERQFDPVDVAFVPRAFSITHINLTHRNWTAIGLPDYPELPIVDPRGLLTPILDQWSLDTWLLTGNERQLLPSRAIDSVQSADLVNTLAIITDTRVDGMRLQNRAEVILEDSLPVCRMTLTASSDEPGWLIIALRPYNPEGISFVHEVSLSEDRCEWTIDRKHHVKFDTPATKHHVSDYKNGDVFIHLQDLDDQTSGICDVGMVTAAALFELNDNKTCNISATIPLVKPHSLPTTRKKNIPISWPLSLSGHCQLQLPDNDIQFLYDMALRSLVTHSPEDVYPGPYTYKRFWFRDAAFIINALLCAGLIERAERALDRFAPRQSASGYFHSQEGEWDSNGEALWIMQRFCQFTNSIPKADWQQAITRAGHWIIKKRLPAHGNEPHAGLLPAGFSAEHLGPNDYYYWDDFWSIEGLHAASRLCDSMENHIDRDRFNEEAQQFMQAVDSSLAMAAERIGRQAMPASPYRRLDAGAIGSIAAGYPLQLFANNDPRLLDSVAFLMDNCLVDSAFFQDMIHSGLNAYLTLHIAQVLLRAGDARCFDLINAVARLASPTGQWPEAIHPHTLGGCMGDGHHVWAAAEWIVMIRNCFVREEGAHLILGSGIHQQWLQSGEALSLGPAPTIFGPISITLQYREEQIEICWHAEWFGEPPEIDILLPGWQAIRVTAGESSAILNQRAAA